MEQRNYGARDVLNQMLAEGFDRDRVLKELDRQDVDFAETVRRMSRDIIGIDGMIEEQNFILDYLSP